MKHSHKYCNAIPQYLALFFDHLAHFCKFYWPLHHPNLFNRSLSGIYYLLIHKECISQTIRKTVNKISILIVVPVVNFTFWKRKSTRVWCNVFFRIKIFAISLLPHSISWKTYTSWGVPQVKKLKSTFAVSWNKRSQNIKGKTWYKLDIALPDLLLMK